MTAYFKHKSGRFPLDRGICSFGRDPSCTYFFDDQELSRKHALVVHMDGRYSLLDFKSSNGVFVNDHPVDQCILESSDLVQMGSQMFEFICEESPETVAGGGAGGVAAPQAEGVSTSGGERTRLFTMLDLGRKDLSSESESLSPSTPAGDEVEDAIRRLVNLYKVSTIINSELDLQQLLEKVIDSALEVMQADRGFIMLVNEETRQLEPTVSRRMEGMMAQDGPITISRSIVTHCFEETRPILTKDALVDERFQTSGSIQMYNIRSAVCVPLCSKIGETIGVIYVDTRIQSDCLEEDDLEMLSAFADQAAIAIENAKLYAKVEEETRQRTNLSRFLSPDIVDKIIQEKGDISRAVNKVEATILFADIRGFTSFSEHQGDPEVVVSVLNQYLERMTRCIFEEGGTLDKYLGDGLLAIFGAPFRAEDAPFRAVRAAMKMQIEMARLCEEWTKDEGFALKMGIGINTGEVVAGSIGSPERMDYTVIGDAVNTSSRLCSVAGPDEIIVTDSTYRAVADRILARELPPVTVKGKQNALQVYQIVRMRRGPGDTGAHSSGRVPIPPS